MKNNLVKNMARCLAATGLVCGLIASASAAPVTEIEPNNSHTTAQNIDSFFDLSFNVNVGNISGTNTSTLIPHAEVQGLRNRTASFDYFSFQGTAGSWAIFDIDCGYASSRTCASTGGRVDYWLELVKPSGIHTLVRDDHIPLDVGSIFPFDPFMQTRLTVTGLYTIAVAGVYFRPIPANGDYILNVSIQNHAVAGPTVVGTTVPEPAPLALLGFGLLGLGLARRRKSEV